MYETLVIGAGAAGLAAARALADAGAAPLVLEARDRIGGRVWTDDGFGPAPVERGAEFIHGSSVETWRWLRRAGLHALPFPTWSGRRIALGGQRRAGPLALRLRRDLRPMRAAEDDLARYDGPDISLAEWMRRRSYSPLAAHIVDIRLAHACCATAETLSAAELAFELREGSSDAFNFHVAEGYSRLLARIAEGLDIRTSTPVTRVRWDEDGVEAETPSGSFAARRAVVTLPLALLRAGAVAFEPALPEPKRQAIAAITMPPALKLLYRFDAPFWEGDLTFLTADDPVPVWWTVRPYAPLLVGFATGYRAERLAALGGEAALERGLAALTSLYGPAPRRLLAAAEMMDWGAEPYTLGGYSSVPPGSHGQRARLAAPCGALHFAGEATVFEDNPATVHGALLSGERAAREVLAAR